jgi:glycosyltransferase involved in cell wall biosynthesis
MNESPVQGVRMKVDPKPIRNLLVVSHVRHYRYKGRLYAHGPYAREIEIWADLFPRVTIASPCLEGTPSGDCLPLNRPNIAMAPQVDTGGRTWKAKIRQLFAMPRLIWGLSRAMRQADAIHVRCPGNLGLLGCLLAPLFSRYLVAKYAGQWNGYPGESWSVRLQRALLRSSWWRGPVTVYGNWPDQPAHVVPSFTSSLSAAELARAKHVAAREFRTPPLRLVYVGRLCPAKHVDTLVAAMAMLVKQGVPVCCTLVGDGPERHALEAEVARHGLGEQITFAGGVPFDRVLDHYESSHVLVLVSQNEGWGKVVLEGMAFGLIAIGSDRGLLPEILGQGRGLVVPVGDAEALAMAIRRIAEAPEEYRPMRQRAADWAQQYSLESLREALRTMLTSRWKTPMGEASSSRETLPTTP